MIGPDHSITITLTVPATPAAIYAAWTHPPQMTGWMGEKVEADVRVGGSYRTENRNGNGGVFIHQGKYLALEPDRRVKQTFLAGEHGRLPTQSPYVNEFIEITLHSISPDETEMTFTNGWNGRAMSESDEEATRQAWLLWLDLMVKSL